MQLQRHSNGDRFSVTARDLAGSGGEARVFIVPPDGRLAAKVYHRPTHPQLHKLRVMLANPPEDPAREQAHNSIAWPVDLLSEEDGGRHFAGFLMPRVEGMRPLFQVYNPSVRRRSCRIVDYLYLHRAARNLAAAVRALHSRDYVIGDINEFNILVGKTALITLVDTDSFQVRDPETGAVFRCPVGKPEYTPPELQGIHFTSVDRTAEHDRFGLAVLIFQLLMEGTHPYAGLFTGAAEPPPYESRIASGHFVYGNRHGPYRPMPIAPSFELLDPDLRLLFLRCFEDGHAHPAARPDALTWQNALTRAERSLTACARNPQHRYGGHLSACPWCERKALLGGRDPFPPMAAAEEAPPPRITASSLLRGAPQGAWQGGSGSAPTAPAPPGWAPGPASWQARAPLAASTGSGRSVGMPTPTLFAQALTNSAWAFGAVFWAILAIASAPLGLTGLNLLMTLISVGCGIADWRGASRPVARIKWLSLASALSACLSLSVRPPSAAQAVGVAMLSAGTGPVRSLSFSPDGALLAAGTGRMEDSSLTEGEVNVWDVRARRIVSTPERASGDVVSIAFAPDGQSLVAATDSPFGTGEVVLVNAMAVGAYQSVFKQRQHMRQVAWSRDGALIASAGAERMVRLWDAKTLQPLRSIELPGIPAALAFSPDSTKLAVGCGSGQGSVAPGFVSVWEASTGRGVWTLPAHGNGVQAVAFAPDGGRLASSGNDGAICLWDTRSGKMLERRTAHSFGIAAIAFSPDGAQIATAEARGTEAGTQFEVVLRNGATGVPIRSLSGSAERIAALAYSPTGGLLASGGLDGHIRLWRTASK